MTVGTAASSRIAIVGSPTALGGHFGGMERSPAELRRAGLLDRLRSRPGLAGATFVDHGDAPNDPGWAPDPDPVMKNRQLLIEFLGRLGEHTLGALRADGVLRAEGWNSDSSGVIAPSAGDASGVIAGVDPSTIPTSPVEPAAAANPAPDSAAHYPTGITGETVDLSGRRSPAHTSAAHALPAHASPAHTSAGRTPLTTAPKLLMLGGDCTTHAGAMAALKRLDPGARLAIAWFDAHGDFNIPETTPSGNIWGMPFAMLCGRGDPGLVAACDGPTVREEDAALIGAQVLDQQESRMLASSPVAQFGAEMLAGAAGLAALEGWARTVGERCDGLYIAFDLDAIDASEGVCVAMPEPDGLSVETSVAALRILALTNRIVGFGATATMRRPDDDDAAFERHVDIVAQLVEAALG